ncbi:serine hydrolase domain-containing protein [Novosphingobium album (ex Liu et al. 2023)]|uniref:Serine hydrolase n=1 Tax=Novosphingobium album (ex Liu et al. 2023) TaxID=3031130 RepID=A0ABT5WPA2_9SPHN|nr:serine hydrolase [Novosphingobium album (ex Liu et al. 2023)]MDE8651704.1 serine hydrolase [Novosphingobium album (ex Liu et al. 2023)]
MTPRRLPHILALLALPALSGCGGKAPPPPPPPSAQAEAAIKADGGAAHAVLGRAIDGLFDEEAVGQTRALLIVKRGSVIAERYGEGIGPGTRLPGWSMGQCVTGVMVGQLVSDGRLRLDETAPVPAWQRSGDPRGEITLRQLLQMRSGLRHSEGAGLDPGSDRARMLFLDGRDDMAAYAESQPLEDMPGRVFENSSATPVILADLAARALTDSRDPERRRQAVADYLRTRVLDPIGMRTTVADYDAAGTMIGSSMIHASARDWGKLGDFLRHYGSVNGGQILPRRWIEFMRAPSPRNAGYGAQLWLNGPQSTGRQALWPGQSPANLFACLGEGGQYLVSSPDQLLTVVRLGHSEPEQEAALHDRIGALLRLFPGG